MQPQSAPAGPIASNAHRESTSNMPPPGASCWIPTTPAGVSGIQSLPGLVASDNASQTLPSAQELNMILKLIQTYLNDLPKLGMGDPATRPSRLISWKAGINQALHPVGSLVKNWCHWILQKAELAHQRLATHPSRTERQCFPLSLCLPI